MNQRNLCNSAATVPLSSLINFWQLLIIFGNQPHAFLLNWLVKIQALQEVKLWSSCPWKQLYPWKFLNLILWLLNKTQKTSMDEWLMCRLKTWRSQVLLLLWPLAGKAVWFASCQVGVLTLLCPIPCICFIELKIPTQGSGQLRFASIATTISKSKKDL